MKSGRTFDGDWENNLPHGTIKETVQEGGDVYEGQFFEGKRCGQGVLKLQSGKIYTGNFVDNLPSGQGKLEIPNELVYTGTFTPNGDTFKIEGKIMYKDGREVEGSWDDIEQ